MPFWIYDRSEDQKVGRLRRYCHDAINRIEPLRQNLNARDGATRWPRICAMAQSLSETGRIPDADPEKFIRSIVALRGSRSLTDFLSGAREGEKSSLACLRMPATCVAYLESVIGYDPLAQQAGKNQDAVVLEMIREDLKLARILCFEMRKIDLIAQQIDEPVVFEDFMNTLVGAPAIRPARDADQVSVPGI